MRDDDPSLREKLTTVYEAVRFRPGLGAAIVILGFVTALLEGIGLGFLLPIIEIAQSSTSPSSADGLLGVFVEFYSLIGLPFTLEYLILGVAAVMGLRFGLSFLSTWLSSIMSLSYQRRLRDQLFKSLLYGPIEHIDQAGSDTLLNSLITETNRASVIVMAAFGLVGTVLRGLVYLTIAAFLSPILTLVAIVGLGVSTITVRYILEPAYTVGDDVAETNDEFQSVSQTGIQGMRDVRLFNMRTELLSQVRKVLTDYVAVGVRLRRNQAALNNLNRFANVLVVFGLVYVGFRFTGIGLSELGVFLFAVFRLSPVINQINSQLYRVDGQLPQLIRVRRRISTLNETAPIDSDSEKSVKTVERIEFDNISFSYETNERVLQDVTFSVERGEKVALVGPSGAGKSTIISILSRLQTPDSGQILADGIPIREISIEQWRSRLAIVRQDPFLFNDTLRENVKIGNREASQHEVEQVCEIAQVTEFLSDLPNGYDTQLGEDGIRLSGGQKQRVAIARALLKDADILVLDEATSELDSNIERRVYEKINTLEDHYATISIAHQLSTVNDADRIYTLVDGSVVEVGTHEQLISRNGVYSDLYAAQS